MMQHLRLEHRFVEFVPERLEPGILYVSMDYATASHSCCCGCGEEIVTPFTPTDWKMTFDGETISLNPSVGNWHQACRSHYVVDRSRVLEAGPWSDEDIAAERQRDKTAKAAHYRRPQGPGADHRRGEKHQMGQPHRRSVRGWLANLLEKLSDRCR